MNDTLTCDARELLKHYDTLAPEDRQRVLDLVRSLRRLEEEARLLAMPRRQELRS
jgi:hypothetical protein